MKIGKPPFRPLAILVLATAAAVVRPAGPPTDTVSGCASAPLAPGITSVKAPPFGATGDGVTDDTAAIQHAINTVAGSGETLLIPKGVYRINPTVDSGRNGLRLGNRMTLRMAPGAVLQATASSSESYTILSVSGVSDVTIIGGTLLGERNTHHGSTGEWGMGLSIFRARHIMVQDVTARDCWGDGFYIAAGSRDVTLCRVISDHNRRQGLSITGADGVVVKDSIFENTTGTPGESGLDIEPNRGDTVSNVLITGCTIRNNGGDGLSSGVPFANTGISFVRDIVIDGNTISGNGIKPGSKRPANGIVLANSSGTRVTRNLCSNNIGRGIQMGRDANDTVCTGNTVTGTKGPPGVGIIEDTSQGNTITGNTATGNAGAGIYSVACQGGTLADNAQSGNGTAR